MRGRLLALVAVAAAVAGLSGGLTYATWGTGASAAGAAVVGGRFDLALVAPGTWMLAGDGTTAPTPLPVAADGTTVDHLATAGDVLTFRQDVRVGLAGDNLEARVVVRWDQAPDLTAAPAVDATYVVTAPDGTSTAPTPLGTAATVALDAATVAAWPDDVWSVTVTVTLGGEDAVVVPPAQVTPQRLLTLGPVVVELEQARGGAS